MSTAVPLPLDATTHEAALSAGAAPDNREDLRRAVTERLQQHRRRRGVLSAETQHALPGIEMEAAKRPRAAGASRVADSVAARFAHSQSYRDFLQEEAEAATRQAEAAAEVARRNADAVAAAQQQLLEDMLEWERREAEPLEAAGLTQLEPAAAAVVAMPATVQKPKDAGRPVLAPSEGAREAAGALAAVKPAPPAKAAVEATIAAPEEPVSLKIALGLEEPTEPPTPLPANLIEFPRQLVAARKARPRLAEGPLREDADSTPERAQLRIFEVDASSFSSAPALEPASSLPEWTSIRLDNHSALHDTTQREAEVSLALPVYAAPLERRVMAAVVDGCCVATAFLLAVAAAAAAGGTLPTGVLAAGVSAVTLLLFGLAYLLLSFTLSGHTLGMRYARIALCTFGDDNPTRSAMRRRLFATGLSAVSLGLGFAWAMLDDDKLGWHDRISRIYQRAY